MLVASPYPFSKLCYIRWTRYIIILVTLIRKVHVGVWFNSNADCLSKNRYNGMTVYVTRLSTAEFIKRSIIIVVHGQVS